MEKGSPGRRPGCLSMKSSVSWPFLFSSNDSHVQPSIFVLLGIPGLENAYQWISIPFLVMYLIALLGNGAMLLLIGIDRGLHAPMYYFLCMLAFTDAVLCSCIVPKLLSIFWFSSMIIYFEACLFQMFVIHMFTSLESGVLLAMAFDRYVAICNPLRYATVLTNKIIFKIYIANLIRGVLIVIPCPAMASRLPYCMTNIIHHSYCDHMAVVKLACADTTVNSAYGLTVVLLVIVFDVIFISVSYVLILRTVYSLPSKAARSKAINTCTAHICIILLFYTLGLFSFLTHRVGHNVSPYVHILMANFYLLVPPVMNPIVYGIKTKEIREKAFKIFHINALPTSH
ncbi:olfactory receptor 52N2-like [Pleurodeles waltl]|uniref:olfactory receptor 52N2-like n=1 Tax=Pleurodeles waltl TaxID=8319 RepID=UPI0037097323